MDSPDKPAAVSLALAGEPPEEPEQIIAVVVTDEENDPSGVLEKWGSDCWIYADADSLRELN
jgi:hypothetical protein